MEAQIAVAKVNKYATSESGDTIEVIERPRGGLSVVVADGQRSGRSAKAISNIVVRKAISLLAEGVRDGAAARATNDYLQIHRGGKVSAELYIASIDLDTKSLVISRNSRCPVLISRPYEILVLDEPSEAVGIHNNTKPAIDELNLELGTTVIIFTDGVWNAGSRRGCTIDLVQLVRDVNQSRMLSAAELADEILEEVMRLEQDRPHDDASVLVIKLTEGVKLDSHKENIRRMSIRVPL